MAFVNALLIGVAVLGLFVALCSVVHRYRLDTAFAAAMLTAFLGVMVWAVSSHANLALYF